MGNLRRFVEFGVTDAETRFAQRLPSPVRDHPLAIDVVGSSAIARFLSRGAHLLRVAADSSLAWRFTRSMADAWSNADWRWRHRSAGVVLVVAVLVHIVLLWLQGLPPGWLWSIVPVIVAAIGIVLMLSGSFVQRVSREPLPGRAVES